MTTDRHKADTPQRKRRCVQFSLRTLLIGVTLLAVPLGYFGWQAKIVRHRSWVLSHFGNRKWPAVVPGELWESQESLPWIRRVVGDRAHSRLEVDRTVPESDFIAIKDAYPEASVVRSDLSGWTEYPPAAK
jgi:hypothetical protein